MAKSSQQQRWAAEYAPAGERISDRDTLANTTTLTIRGLDGKVLRIYGKSGSTWSWSKDYVYEQGLLLASVDAAATKYFALDHLGTVRRITGTGSPAPVLASHDYYPFGLEATSTTQDAERMKFTGHERDLMGTSSQTDDLDYIHARHYNPNLGRFLSPDLLRGNPHQPQSFNLYAYVQNNPMNYVDPFGLKWNSITQREEEDVVVGGDYWAWQHNPLNTLLYGWVSYNSGWGGGGLGPAKFGRGPNTAPECMALPSDLLEEAQTNELLAANLFGPHGVRGIQPVGGPGEFLIFAGAGSLARAGYEIGIHAAERMAERGITEKMVQVALRKGTMYFDPKNGTVNYVLEGGFASGKSLLVGQIPETGVVATVIRSSKLVKSRFVPYCE